MRPAPWTQRGKELRQKQIENSTEFTMSNSKKGRGRGTKKKGEFLNVSVVLAGEIVEGLIMGIVVGLIFVIGLQR